MIFITTGSRSFQFNRLLRAVDEAIENGLIKEEVFAQIGLSNYKIKNFKYVSFMNHDEFNRKIKECDVVITHGGTGVIVNTAKAGKSIVAVPRLKEFNEAVDDHQIQLVQAFEKLGVVVACYECSSENISNAIKFAKKKEIVPYISNTNVIIDSIDQFIKTRM